MKKRRFTFLSVAFIGFIVMSFSMLQRSFKEDQKRYPRVRTAYAQKSEVIKNQLLAKGLKLDGLQIYLRVFKFEKELELWGRNSNIEKFKKIKTVEVCATSGKLGPKRKQGDLQIPEGFYHIDRFNPVSNFYLSLGINYPNKSDRILGVKSRLGGDIFIHGDCVTIGCVPITDNLIKELYVYCVEAKNQGQKSIPVTIFPAKLSADKYAVLKENAQNEGDKLNLWKSLKKGYDLFDKNRKLPSIQFLPSGQYQVGE
jgi:murein L,D-transpeptidase YafK